MAEYDIKRIKLPNGDICNIKANANADIKLFRGTCTTAAATVEKAVTTETAFTSSDLVAGAIVMVRFTVTNTAAVGSITLNVNGTGAKRIQYYKAGAKTNLAGAGRLRADGEYIFFYDGTYWCAVVDENTTYSSMSQSEATTGTATTARSISAKVLHDSISEIADNYIPWGGTDQLERLTPDQSWTISGATYSQGMAGDGTYLYLTNRANSSATTAMKITRLNMSTMAVVDTHTVGQGHYNSLYYYEGKLYGTGVTSSNNYSKVSVIDTSTWSETIKDSPSTWGVGVRKFANKGYITALWVASQRAITYYDSYILDTSNKQTPLAKVTLDFTGSTTVQGSFHMTDRYIWTLETTYSDETRASGHQVIRCFTYGGMLVKAWYVDSITDELEDIWVSDDNLTAYVNTINGKIYKFTFPALYRTLTSSISEVGSLKSGTLKHVYSYPAPNSVSSRQTYTRGSSSYYFTRAFAISDFAFLGEIGEFIPPTLWLNNKPLKGTFYNNYSEIWFHGSFNWAGGGRLSAKLVFTRTLTSTNYYYWLTRVAIDGRDDSLSSPRIEYDVSTTPGSWTSDMENCISKMYTDGWFYGNFYIESLSYIVGMPNSSTDLAIIN